MYLQAVTDETGNTFHHTEVNQLTEQMRGAVIRIFVCVNDVPEYFMYVVKSGKRVGTVVATISLGKQNDNQAVLIGLKYILSIFPNLYISPKSSRYSPDIAWIAHTSLGMLKANQKESYKCKYVLSEVEKGLLSLKDVN